MYNSNSSPAVTNCILWGNSPNEISGGANVSYSDIQGGYEGTGNIDADPLFVDLSGGNFHLGQGSPCIDAGTNDAPNLPDYDFEGDSRVMDGDGDGMAIVDMGMDEFAPYFIFVDQEATGNGDGTSWTDAYNTLQPALEAARGGEEIWVAAGMYTPTQEFSPGDPRSATFQLKNGVTLHGGFDPTVGDVVWEDRDWVGNFTILSGDIGTVGTTDDNSYHVFYHPPELELDASAVLNGFTVTDGNASADASPHNVGGGMYNDGSSPTVTNCSFSGNSADRSGGGMNNSGFSSPVVDNCTFSGNSAEYGGGMSNSSFSSPRVSNCTFSGNSAVEVGGGMYNDGSSPAVSDSTFSGNSAIGVGGGMGNGSDSSPLLVNCSFLDNSAGEGGGGVYSDSSSPTLTNCTFLGNTAATGGGMHNDGSSPTVTNCILWGDSPDEIFNNESEPVVTYSDIQGGYDGTGNIDADPFFVDPGNGDHHLGPGSPCVDAGTNDAPYLPSYDFEGDSRVIDGDRDGTAVVDMGIDESRGIRIYVDRDARGDNNGTCWEDALTDLQQALARAVDGVEIWVAAGVYTPTLEFSPGDPRSATFQLKNGVALYGGFGPTVGDTGWEDRDWVNNLTILSGDIGTVGDPADNSYHVFYHPDGLALDGTAVLDGFTVTDGNASSADWPHRAGGGMFNYGSSPALNNCTFSNNSANSGGGMFNMMYSSPVVTNCTFSDNSAVRSGGGMVNEQSSSPVMTNCTFSGNSAGFHGGGMSSSLSSLVMTNCTFSDNLALHGGGMSSSYSSPVVINCTFSGNSASGVGGGMINGCHDPRYTSPSVVTNCTFSGNSADQGGGAVYNACGDSRYKSLPVLTNCVLWMDSPNEFYNEGGVELVVTYSDIQGGYEGEGNIDADPLFLGPDNGDFHLGPCSPCIDAADNSAPRLPPYDFEGDPRILDGDDEGTAIVDMGVDEAVAGTCFRIYLPVVLRNAP
jgi:parallel beta-helix repeat protein/predicted outer membrane repeat protein